MTWKELKTKVIETMPFKTKIKSVSEADVKTVVKHTFEQEVKGDIDLDGLRQALYFSPWSTAGFKHSCKILKKEDGKRVLQVQFKALSKGKIKDIEDLISNHLDK